MKYQIVISSISLILLNIFSVHGQVQLEPACAESIQRYGVTGSLGSRFIWSFDHDYGQVLNGEGTDTITIQWYYGRGNVQLEVQEITNAGCMGIPSIATLEVVAPEVDLGPDFPEICEGDSLLLSLDVPYNILWIDSTTSDEHYFDKSGIIWVKVTDNLGCFRYDTINLLVNPLPEVYIGDSVQLCDSRDPYILDPGVFAQYDWTTYSGQTSSQSSYMVAPSSIVADTIFLTVTDYNGCRASDQLIVFPCDLSKMFEILPNTITPDGDGMNDVWNIPYMDLFDHAELEIFDRWGRLVYRTENVYEEPWDGTSRERELPMDSYYFVLKLNAFNAAPIVGTVNLIR